MEERKREIGRLCGSVILLIRAVILFLVIVIIMMLIMLVVEPLNIEHTIVMAMVVVVGHKGCHSHANILQDSSCCWS